MRVMRSRARTALSVALATFVVAWMTGSARAHEAAERAPFRAASPAPIGPATPSSPDRPAIPFAFGGPFALVDQDGRPRTDRDFRGVFMLVFFGYAGCEDMCPLALGALATALDALGPEGARVQPLFITVDPMRDTPRRLKAWAQRLHPRLLALTGDTEAIGAAMRAYGVSRTRHDGRSGRTLYAHGLYSYLMRPDGSFAALIPPVMPPAEIARLIRRHIDAASDGG